MGWVLDGAGLGGVGQDGAKQQMRASDRWDFARGSLLSRGRRG